MKKKKIAVLMTTYNRLDYTKKCIETLITGNPEFDFRFVITDDLSSDGTVEYLKKSLGDKVHLIEGTGSLFWNGGMRVSMGYALNALSADNDAFEYALLVNDDVEFYDRAIEKMITRLENAGASAVAGATRNSEGAMTYGCVLKTSDHFAKFKLLEPSKEVKQADTFNCNCVLIKSEVFFDVGMLDKNYRHSMGDYDYGMMIRRKGYIIINGEDYAGRCSDNDITGSWRDTSLSRKERIRKKESPKGLPAGDWFYFVKKNYGLLSAVYHSVTPYIRILINK